MNTPITYEAPRFGRTGPGFCQDLRDGFIIDALAYGLDAPDHIARGSATGYLQTFDSWSQHYVAFTVNRSDR